MKLQERNTLIKIKKWGMIIVEYGGHKQAMECLMADVGEWLLGSISSFSCPLGWPAYGDMLSFLSGQGAPHGFASSMAVSPWLLPIKNDFLAAARAR